MDCIIGSWEAIFKVSAHGWTVAGQGSDIGHRSVRDVDSNLSNVDVVLYRRHCDICGDVFFISEFS